MKFKGRKDRSRMFKGYGAVALQAARRELQRGGLMIENDATESIIEQTPGGLPYPSKGRKGAIHWASPEGAAPNADTGELHTSITTTTKNTTTGVEVQTGSNTPYGTALEFGTSRMAPRPYMRPAFKKNVRRISQNVAQAIRRANKTKR